MLSIGKITTPSEPRLGNERQICTMRKRQKRATELVKMYVTSGLPPQDDSVDRRLSSATAVTVPTVTTPSAGRRELLSFRNGLGATFGKTNPFAHR